MKIRAHAACAENWEKACAENARKSEKNKIVGEKGEREIVGEKGEKVKIGGEWCDAREELNWKGKTKKKN